MQRLPLAAVPLVRGLRQRLVGCLTINSTQPALLGRNIYCVPGDALRTMGAPNALGCPEMGNSCTGHKSHCGFLCANYIMSAALIRRRPHTAIGLLSAFGQSSARVPVDQNVLWLWLRSWVFRRDNWQHLQQEVESGLIDSDCCPRTTTATRRGVCNDG